MRGNQTPLRFCPRCARIVLAGLLSIALSGCATNPVTKKTEFGGWVSEQEEIRIGQANYLAYQQAQGGEYVTDQAVVSYVQSVGQKLWSVSDRPNLPFEIVVLNSSVPNAWAIPGGKMAINRGLLTELHSESELAAVLGHEIVHVAARHGAHSQEVGTFMQVLVLGAGLGAGLSSKTEDYQDVIMQGSGLAAGLTSLKFGRGDELEADKYGIAYLSRAGYDVQSAVTLQETFLKLADDPGLLGAFFSTHPPTRERVDANKATVQKYPAGGVQGREEFARAMAGLIKDKPAYKKLDEGEAALAKKNPAAALASAQAAIALQPREAHFYALAGKAQAAQHQYPQAVESLTKAISLNNQYYEYYLDRGQVRCAMGSPQAARPDLEKSLTLLPTDTAHYLLGTINMNSGNQRAARENFRAASFSSSSDGQKSGVLLAQLEIGENPERYLQVGYTLNQRGFLVLTVQNNSPVDVGTCVLGLASPRSGRWETVTVPGGVPARRAARVPTNIGPFASLNDAQSVRYRFERVDVATSPAAPGSGFRRNRGR